MKILQVNAVNVLSSTGRTTLELSKELRMRGHQNLTVHALGPRTEDSFAIGDPLDRKAHAFLARTTGLQGYWSTRATKEMLGIIVDYKPDVVRLGNLHSNFVHVPHLLEHLAEHRIPTVLTLHDCWFFTGKCTHYSAIECLRWQNGCGSCPQLRDDIPSWFFDRTSRMWKDKRNLFAAHECLGVVGVSDWITGQAASSFLATARILTRIYNWVDLDTFRFRPTNYRRRNGWGNDFLIMAVASEWSMTKGLRDLIELAGALPQDMRLLIVGALPEGLVLPRSVVRIGEVSSPIELAKLYSAADVFLNVSTQESFGKVSAEALACGTPIVTNPFTANPELVGQGCGYVVENVATESLLRALLAVQQVGREAFSADARAFAEENFSLKSNVTQYEALFARLIAC